MSETYPRTGYRPEHPLSLAGAAKWALVLIAGIGVMILLTKWLGDVSLLLVLALSLLADALAHFRRPRRTAEVALGAAVFLAVIVAIALAWTANEFVAWIVLMIGTTGNFAAQWLMRRRLPGSRREAGAQIRWSAVLAALVVIALIVLLTAGSL